MTQCCQKYASHGKKLKIKVVRNRIWFKKVRERICLSPPPPSASGARGSQDQCVWNVIIYKNENLSSLYDSKLPKIHSWGRGEIFFLCNENFWQRWALHWMYLCIFPLLYSIIFKPYQSFKPLSSTLGGDRHMRSQTFLDKIRIPTIFTFRFFPCDAYFW